MSIDTERIAYWRGRRIEQLTREELIDALNVLAYQIETMQKHSQHERDMLREIRRNG